jgi:hypothetical protein
MFSDSKQLGLVFLYHLHKCPERLLLLHLSPTRLQQKNQSAPLCEPVGCCALATYGITPELPISLNNQHSPRQAHFEDNPRDLQVLRHNQQLDAKSVNKAVSTIPSYLMPSKVCQSTLNNLASMLASYIS